MTQLSTSASVANWRTATVTELESEGILLVEDGNHGEYRPRSDEFCDRGTAFIRAADMDGGRVSFDKASHINDTALRRIRKGIGAGGDILLSHKGTVGKVAYVPLDAPAFVCSPQTTFWRSLDVEKIDRRYLYYLLCSAGFHRQLSARKGETDMADYVSLTNQRLLIVTLPPIAEQKFIATILSVFDHKIEVSRQTNELLEQGAQGLFKSWFVDFDPVRAKIERHGLALPKRIADIFPGALQSSELGDIPVGWRAGRITDLICLNPTERIAPGTTSPYLEMADLPERGPLHAAPRAREFSSGSKFRRHDTLLARITPCLENGKTAYVAGLHEAEIGWGSTEFIVMRAKPPAPPPFAYALARDDAFREYAIQSMTGTSGRQRVQTEALASYPFVIPDPEILNQFGNATEPIFDRIFASGQEIAKLTSLRDTLLPKLISGEICVKDAERLVVEHV